MMPFLTQMADPALFAAVLRVMTPLLLAALGVLISDRAGVINIGMEGMMLLGALTGVLVSAWSGSPWLGLLASVALCAGVGALMGLVVTGLGADLIITGIALNVAASSGTTLGLYFATGEKGMSGSLRSGVLPDVVLPGIDLVPVLGRVVSGHHLLTYGALLAVPAIGTVMSRTPFGLHLRAVGTDPTAAEAAGLSAMRVKTAAMALSGGLGGAAGAYLSMGYVSWFAQNMVAGRGFIAVAIEVMGMGTAWGTLLASAVVAGAETVAIQMQTLGFPNELVQVIPYAIPVVLLTVWTARRRRSPRS